MFAIATVNQPMMQKGNHKMTIKTYKDFPDFYANPFIQSIAKNKKWTVSTPDKVPIDMVRLKYENEIYGAFLPNDLCLTTLENVVNEIPTANNNAYYFDYLEDNAIVLDVEPKCPEAIKQQFMQMNYIYGETSMSGKGIHLIFNIPKCIEKYPIAQQKIALKEKHGYYEILLCHYVTFTRNMLPPATGHDTIDNVFETLCRQQKESNRKATDVEIDKPEIPKEERLLQTLSHLNYSKKPEDFYDDMSKYEYGLTGFFYNKLKRQIALPHYLTHTYTDNEKAWLLYQITSEKLPHRAKHDETRDGLPWLLYLAEEIIAKDTKKKKKK